jgi:hypothetical protein
VTRAPILAAAMLAMLPAAHAEKLYLERFGGDPVIPLRVQNHAVIPPAQYDKPYMGTLIVTWAKTVKELHELCKPLNDPLLMACSKRYNDHACWIMYGPVEHMTSQGYTLETVKRHELAHCQSWPQDHPGGRTAQQAHEDEVRAGK